MGLDLRNLTLQNRLFIVIDDLNSTKHESPNHLVYLQKKPYFELRELWEPRELREPREPMEPI